MAIKKTIELDVNTSAGLRAMDELGLSFEEAFTEADNLTGQIGELEDALYAMAAAGQQNTEEYRELAEQIGVYKKVIIDTDLQVDAMSQTTAQKLGGALTGVTAGFELGAGAMGAMGVESEKVEEALLRVQSAMAIAQGVQGIKEAIPSFKSLALTIGKTAAGQKVLNAAQAIGAVGMKALNVVMKANPVFLLIGAFTALAGAVAWFSSRSNEAEAQNERLNASLKRGQELLDSTIKKVTEAGNHRLAVMQAEGAAEEDLHNQRLKNLKAEEAGRKASLEFEKKALTNLIANQKQAFKEGNDELAQSIAEEIDQHKNKYKELQSQHKNYARQKELEDIAYQNSVREKAEQEKAEQQARYREALARKREFESKRLAISREIQDLELALQQEGIDKQFEANQLEFDRRIEDLRANKELESEERIRLEELAQAKYTQRIIEIEQAEEERKRAKKEKEAEELALLNEQTELALQEQLDREQELLDKQREEQLEKDAAAIEQKKEMRAGMLDASMKGLQALDDLNTLLTDNAVKKAGDNEAAAEAARKKGFERSKKLQLGMAIITGIQGVMAAFTAGSSMGPAGVVMGPIMAALAAVTAGVNIAKIAKTRYEGGGSSSGAATGSTAPPRVPSFNIAGNSTGNQLAQSLGGQEQQPIKSYVVSSDVTSAQSLDRNKIETASI